jgi:hypothetical protein
MCVPLLPSHQREPLYSCFSPKSLNQHWSWFIVYDMEESKVQTELCVEVGKVLWDDLMQVTFWWNKLLPLMLGPFFFFRFINFLDKTEWSLLELQLSGENKLFFFMHTVERYAADLLVVLARSVWNFKGDRDAFNHAMLLLFDHSYDILHEKVLVVRTSSGATSWSCESPTGHS